MSENFDFSQCTLKEVMDLQYKLKKRLVELQSEAIVEQVKQVFVRYDDLDCIHVNQESEYDDNGGTYIRFRPRIQLKKESNEESEKYTYFIYDIEDTLSDIFYRKDERAVLNYYDRKVVGLK